MKPLIKIAAAVAIALSLTSCASAGGGHIHQGGGRWVAPLIIGAIVGTAIANQSAHSHPREPVYGEVPILPSYRPSYTYRPMYKAVDVYIPECNCTRTFMVQIN